MDSFWSGIVSDLVVLVIGKLLDITVEAIKNKVSTSHAKHSKKP